MTVTINYTYKHSKDGFNHIFENVTSIKETFDYKLGAEVTLKIEGKRNRVRIPAIEIRYMTVIE